MGQRKLDFAMRPSSSLEVSVGSAYKDGIYEHAIREHSDGEGKVDWGLLPIVAKFDGFLNDSTKFAVPPQYVVKGIDETSSDPGMEDDASGGTGMIYHWFTTCWLVCM
jgi:D-aminopeptidase